MFRNERKAIYQKWLTIFVVSFLTGILLVNFFSNTLLSESGIFNSASMNRLRDSDIESGRFFGYVLSKRLKDYLLFGLLSTTYLGVTAVYASIIWQGALAGMMISAAVMRFGFKGILLILASIFPHQLILIPAGIMMVCWCYQNCSYMYFPTRSIWPVYRTKKGQYIRQLFLLCWIIGVVIIGCVLESYVNPLLISDTVKIF